MVLNHFVLPVTQADLKQPTSTPPQTATHFYILTTVMLMSGRRGPFRKLQLAFPEVVRGACLDLCSVVRTSRFSGSAS